MPPNLTLLEHANSAIRHVKFSCPIGAYTSDVDIEKTRSAENSISWAEVMVSTLRGKYKFLSERWKKDTEDAYEAAAQWVEDILKLKPRESLGEELKFIYYIEGQRQQVYSPENAMLYIYHKVGEHAGQMKSGNCGEQAALAFVYLLKHNVLPLDFCKVKNGDHAFVVIGRSKESNPNDLKTWGNAVICDPFNNQAFIAKDATPEQIRILLGDKEDASPSVEYRQEKDVYRNAKGEKTEAPNIPLSLKDVYKKLIEMTVALKNPVYKPVITKLSAKYNGLDGENKLNQLISSNRVTERQMDGFLAEIKLLDNKPVQETTLFFQRITKPPILDKKIQQQIHSFSFQK